MGESTKLEYYKKSILDKLFSKKQKNIEIEIMKEHCIFLEKKISEWGIETEKKIKEIENKWKKAHKWANETEVRLYEIEKLHQIPLNTKDLIQQLHERICELEKIVKNQPLIKKYQKTLDIFLKNAQD